MIKNWGKLLFYGHQYQITKTRLINPQVAQARYMSSSLYVDLSIVTWLEWSMSSYVSPQLQYMIFLLFFILYGQSDQHSVGLTVQLVERRTDIAWKQKLLMAVTSHQLRLSLIMEIHFHMFRRKKCLGKNYWEKMFLNSHQYCEEYWLASYFIIDENKDTLWSMGH